MDRRVPSACPGERSWPQVQSSRMIRRGLRLVLTGGIGAGKSTVAEALRRHGVEVVDADRLGHAALEPGGDAYAEVARTWPQVVVEGRIDRSLLADVVFHDGQALRFLESLVHPAVRRRVAEADHAAGEKPLAVEVSVPAVLPGDDGWTVVVVRAPESLRRRRLEGRGMSPADVSRRMAAQPDAASWRRLADFVLDNDTGEEDLESRVVDLLEALRLREEGAVGD